MQAVTEGTGGRGAQVVNIDPTKYLEDLINQGKERDREIARLSQSLEEERVRSKEREQKLKKLEVFEDLLDDDESEWYTVPALRDKVVWRLLKGRVTQLFGQGNLTNMNVRVVVTACLRYALRTGHWGQVKLESFDSVRNG